MIIINAIEFVALQKGIGTIRHIENNVTYQVWEGEVVAGKNRIELDKPLAVTGAISVILSPEFIETEIFRPHIKGEYTEKKKCGADNIYFIICSSARK